MKLAYQTLGIRLPKFRYWIEEEEARICHCLELV